MVTAAPPSERRKTARTCTLQVCGLLLAIASGWYDRHHNHLDAHDPVHTALSALGIIIMIIAICGAVTQLIRSTEKFFIVVSFSLNYV